MKRKLSSLQRDMKRMMVDLKNLQNRVTEMLKQDRLHKNFLIFPMKSSIRC